MKFRTRLAFVFLCLVLSGCSNPFAPTSYELTNSVSTSPDSATISLSEEQIFVVYGGKDHLEDIGFQVLGVGITDPVCRCTKTVRLGRLDRPEADKLVYYAPVLVPDEVSLPVSIEIYAYARKDDIFGNRNYKTVAKVTLIR